METQINTVKMTVKYSHDGEPPYEKFILAYGGTKAAGRKPCFLPAA
ncbi:hypothetical protein QUW46_02075 [Limosilactobacillus panis]|uniref:Uncharacterized protein n=1 Tax=Limosilactobacillus panis TaxID=47493 RepID=A0ABT7VKW0_9LACO|nr:hypothetical protein [Limosilactobacillus panis]